MSHALLAIVLAAFPALVIAGGILDLASYRIPNWVSLALLAAFVPAAGLALMGGVSPPALALNLGVGAAALAAGVLMFALRWIGGGDAKLFAAAALWLGWPAAVPFLAATALAGGVLALGLMALRSTLVRPLAASGRPGWAGWRSPARASPMAWPSPSAPWPPSRKACWRTPSEADLAEPARLAHRKAMSDVILEASNGAALPVHALAEAQVPAFLQAAPGERMDRQLSLIHI